MDWTVVPDKPDDSSGSDLSPQAPLLHDGVCDVKPTVKGSSIFKSVLEWDSQCSMWIHRIGMGIPRFLLQALEYSGDGLFWVPATAAICLAPVFAGQQFFSNLLAGFLFDLTVVGSIKALIRRPRPVYNRGMYLVVSVDHYSFPSGHSSRAFLILVFFMEHSSLWNGMILSSVSSWVKDLDIPNVILDFETLVYPIIAFTVVLWALASASSRILLGRHYLLDVVAGSLIGVLEALFVLRLLDKYRFMFQHYEEWLAQTQRYLGETILRVF